MEKKLTVEEIYQCLGLFSGLSQLNTETKKQESIVLGFVNEKSISEGMRRIANKVTKKLNDNYPLDQIQQIQSEETDIIEKQAKLKELVDGEVIINFEELPDFKLLDERLEQRKETLSHNYTYIFEKLFLNY